MNKKKTILFFRIFPGIMIFLITFIAYRYLFFQSIGKYNFMLGIVMVFINDWIIMVIHELGHAIFLKIKRFPIISIYIPYISIHFGDSVEYKILKSWKSKGLVIPDIPIINSKSEFDLMKKVYVKFLLAGPIATIIFYVMQVVGLVVLYCYCSELKSYSIVLILHTNIKTFFLLHNCFRETRNDIGDILAADRVQKDNSFFASYVYCCYFFSKNYKLKIKESVYIKDIIKKYLENLNEEQLISEVNLIDEVIYRAISGIDNYYNDFLNETIYSFSDILFDCMTSQSIDKNSILSTYLHIVMYMIIVCNDSNYAFQKYLKVEDFLQLKEPMCKYLNSEIKYLFNMETDKPKAIYPVTEYEDWDFYFQYLDCENAILDRKKYAYDKG